MNKKTLSIAAILTIAASTAALAAELPAYGANGFPVLRRAGQRARCRPCPAAGDGACRERHGSPGQRADAAQGEDRDRDHGQRPPC